MFFLFSCFPTYLFVFAGEIPDCFRGRHDGPIVDVDVVAFYNFLVSLVVPDACVCLVLRP